MALTKKCGEMCLIILGCIFGKKCLQMHLPPCPYHHPPVPGPCQLGFSIPGGVEAAIHASPVYLKHPPSDHAVVKVDFRNVFNSICRVLRAVKKYIPDLIPFKHSSYSSPLILMWNDMPKYCQRKAYCKVTLGLSHVDLPGYPQP